MPYKSNYVFAKIDYDFVLSKISKTNDGIIQLRQKGRNSIKHQIDIILSHTCPFKYELREAFLPMINQSSVDDSTERWLDEIEEVANYKACLCGHWHIDKRIEKLHFLFDDVVALDMIKRGFK